MSNSLPPLVLAFSLWARSEKIRSLLVWWNCMGLRHFFSSFKTTKIRFYGDPKRS